MARSYSRRRVVKPRVDEDNKLRWVETARDTSKYAPRRNTPKSERNAPRREEDGKPES